MPIRLPWGAIRWSSGSNSRTSAPHRRRRGVRLVAVDRLDQRRTQRRDVLLPAHRVEEACQRRVPSVLGAVVNDDQRRVVAGRLGRRVEVDLHARDEAPATQLVVLDRAGVGDRVEPRGRARTPAIRRPTCHRTGPSRASGWWGPATTARRRRSGTRAGRAPDARSALARRRPSKRTPAPAEGARPLARAPPPGSDGRGRGARTRPRRLVTRGLVSASSSVCSAVPGFCAPGRVPNAGGGCGGPRSPPSRAAASRSSPSDREAHPSASASLIAQPGS